MIQQPSLQNIIWLKFKFTYFLLRIELIDSCAMTYFFLSILGHA